MTTRGVGMYIDFAYYLIFKNCISQGLEKSFTKDGASNRDMYIRKLSYDYDTGQA